MKTLINAKSILHLTFCAFILFSTILKAQVLEEIPNPAGYTLISHNGSGDGNLILNYYELLDDGYNYLIGNYNGTQLVEYPMSQDEFPSFYNFLEVLTFYSNGLNERFYMGQWDTSDDYATLIFEFDGFTVNPLAKPTGYQFFEYSYNFNNKMYVSLMNPTSGKSLYEYDEGIYFEIPNPTGFEYKNVVAEFNNLLYLSYIDTATLHVQLFSFDGASLNLIPGIPASTTQIFRSKITEDLFYLNIKDTIGIQTLFTYDGLNVNEIPSPGNLSYLYLGPENIDLNEQYIYYKDNANNRALYIYNGVNLTPVFSIAEYDIDFVRTVLNGKTYLSMIKYLADFIFEIDLFNLEAGIYEKVLAPPGYFFAQNIEPLFGDAYYVYRDNSWNRHLMKLDQNSNSVSEIPLPQGYKLIEYISNLNDQIFLITEDSLSLRTLMIYDGTNFTVIENPPNKFLNSYFQQVHGNLYFRYDEIGVSYGGTLYKLIPNGVPTSFDTDNELNAFATVYPTPANDYTTLGIESEKPLEEMHLSIFATSGKLVLQKHFDGLGNSFRETIDVSMLPTGSYFIVGKTPIGQLVKKIQVY